MKKIKKEDFINPIDKDKISDEPSTLSHGPSIYTILQKRQLGTC